MRNAIRGATLAPNCLVDAHVRDAQAGDGLARKALQGLSPLKVGNGIIVNVTASDQYWTDRGRMTAA